MTARADIRTDTSSSSSTSHSWFYFCTARCSLSSQFSATCRCASRSTPWVRCPSTY